MNIEFKDYKFKSEQTALNWVDTLYIKYDVPHGYKQVLKDLATTNNVTITDSQLKVITNILKAEGIEFSKTN